MKKEDTINEIFAEVPKKETKPFSEIIKQKLFSHKNFRITIWRNNGTKSNYITKAVDGNKVVIDKGTYLIDSRFTVFNNTHEMYEIEFHEGLCIPLKHSVDWLSLKSKIKNENAEFAEVETSSDPRVLTEVVKGEYAKGVVKGAEIYEFFEKYKLYIIGTLLLSLASCVIGAKANGWI